MAITLDLYEAADLLKMHWQTLREKAKAGEIPASKPGKRWVFIKEDLVDYLRANYAGNRPRSLTQHTPGGTPCCTSDRTLASTGASSPHQMDAEYNDLLKL